MPIAVLLCLFGAGGASAADALAELASLEPLSLPAPPDPVNVRESVEYYEITGDCERDLQQEMRRKGVRWKNGKVYDSFTRWSIEWDYGYDQAPGFCSPTDVSIIVHVTTRYPRWTGTGAASSALVAKWSTYQQNLELHENLHREMIIEAAAELSRALGSLPAAASCEALDRAVRSASLSRIQQLRNDSKAYDRSTEHGLTQGAVLR